SVDTTEATALPDRFVVMGFEGPKRVFAVFGSPVPPSVAVGPTDRDSPDRRWQVRFDSAEAVGLGIRVPLDITQAQRPTRVAVAPPRRAAGGPRPRRPRARPGGGLCWPRAPPPPPETRGGGGARGAGGPPGPRRRGGAGGGHPRRPPPPRFWFSPQRGGGRPP